MAEPGSKRLYFAVWPDDEQRRALSEAAAIACDASDGKSLPAINYHVTIAFLGRVSAGAIPDVVAAARATRFLPFDLVLEQIGFWPRAGSAWLGPGAPQPALEALVDNLWHRLEGYGFERDMRPYRPHVTVCRKATRGLEKRLAQPLVWPVRCRWLAEPY